MVSSGTLRYCWSTGATWGRSGQRTGLQRRTMPQEVVPMRWLCSVHCEEKNFLNTHCGGCWIRLRDSKVSFERFWGFCLMQAALWPELSWMRGSSELSCRLSKVGVDFDHMYVHPNNKWVQKSNWIFEFLLRWNPVNEGETLLELVANSGCEKKGSLLLERIMSAK